MFRSPDFVVYFALANGQVVIIKIICIDTAFRVRLWQDMCSYNLFTAITSRVATLISASSKDHVTIEYHVMCLVFCMYSTLYSVQYGEILLS